MRLPAFLSAGLLFVGTACLSAAEPVDPTASTKKGITYLEKEGVAWIQERQCAACHHAPLMLWALQEARGRGYTIDEKAVTQVADFTVTADNLAKTLPNPNDKRPETQKLSLAAVYLALGLETRPTADKKAGEVLQRLTSHIVEKQEKDGSWSPVNGRAPLLDSRAITTMLVVLALQPQSKDNVAAAGKWLDAQKATDQHQEIVLRLLLQLRLGRPEPERQGLVKALLARQNADGGWSQTPDMASDAYATGQTLYVLSLAGIKPDDKALERGRHFLAKTQNANGSWTMVSRPMKPGEKGAKNLVPISYAGSAWAVIGLARSTPGSTNVTR